MAAKFATFGEEKMHQFRTRVISSPELKSEQMLKNWKEQDDLTIFKSINQAIVQNSIEDSNFYFSFMKKPRQDILDFLDDAKQRHAKYSKEM